MKILRLGTCLLLGALGCGATTSPPSGGDDGDDQPTPDAGPAPTRTLVGDWLFALQTGKDEILMTSTSSGTAQLYWYDSGEAQWIVDADDDGAGDAQLTLNCTSADCGSAAPIVYACQYSYVELHCVGQSGGYGDNYAGDVANFTKQGS